MRTFTTELSSTSVPNTTKFVLLVVFSARIYDVSHFAYLVMLYIYVDIIERKYIIYLHFLSFFYCAIHIKTCYTLNHIISRSLPLHYSINRPLVVIVVSLSYSVVCVNQWKISRESCSIREIQSEDSLLDRLANTSKVYFPTEIYV